MFTDHHTRTLLAQTRIDQLIAHADAGRRACDARPPRAPGAYRLALLRLVARGLRVERDVRIVVRAPKA